MCPDFVIEFCTGFKIYIFKNNKKYTGVIGLKPGMSSIPVFIGYTHILHGVSLELVH